VQPGYPYAPPPNFTPPSNFDPSLGFPAEGQAPEQVPEIAREPAREGPEITEVPDDLEAPPPYAPPAAEAELPPGDVGADVAADDAIADSYDDGYDPQAYRTFESALAPYGSWIDDVSYGWIWMPSAGLVGANFAPYYSNGHWVLSEFGWTWVSDWSWGWAPFHYGRWTTVAGRGWCWVPGRNWGPAWVSWRSGGGYVGWAPLPPRGLGVSPTVGSRSPWRFTLAASLGAAHPVGIAPRYLPGLFGRTSVVANDRLLTRGPYTVHVNAGPVHGATATPVRLAAVAPHALPRVAIYPRTGTSVGERPWMQAMSTPGRSSAIDGRGFQAPVRSAGLTPTYRAPERGYAASVPAARASQSTFGAGAPTYRAPQASAHYAAPPAAPHYAAPQPAYHYAAPQASRPYVASQPSYHYVAPQPAYHYAAPQPAYHSVAPQPAYHSPAPAPAPRVSYPSAAAAPFGGGSGSFGGGAHFGGNSGSFGGGAHFGGGGGGRRR
jgi:uncharacterized membrane protein YgcG